MSRARPIGRTSLGLVLLGLVAACTTTTEPDAAPASTTVASTSTVAAAASSAAPSTSSVVATTAGSTVETEAPTTAAHDHSTEPTNTISAPAGGATSVPATSAGDDEVATSGPGPTVVPEAPAVLDGMREDTTLPEPAEVEAFGDDRVITVTWAGLDDPRVIGYYVTFRAVGSDETRVIQAQARRGEYGENPGAVQLQPVDNDVEYEIFVRAASGTYEQYPNGPLDAHAADSPDRVSSFARADGAVSAAVTTTATPSSARVDALRERMTGFFDDFNVPAGPFDEQRWNQAATACVAPGSAAAFINPQFHAHNMLRSDCDRSGLVSRPRAVFDIGGASPEQPAAIAMDLDGTSGSRDTWYLDLIPLDAQAERRPLDITSHNDFFDGDTEGPGNMLRINARHESITIAYYDAEQRAVSLDVDAGPTVCGDDPGLVELADCDLSAKRDGLSPLPEPDLMPLGIPNVRRHWLVEIDGELLTLYIDSAPVAVVELPAEFVAAQQFTVHSTVFSYNTGKQYVAPNGDQEPGIGPVEFGAMPYLQMLHWDNFGFTGPPPTEQVANYLEAGATGTQPYYSTGDGTGEIPVGNRTTVIPVPDELGEPVDDTVWLHFTIQSFDYTEYRPVAGDHILFNGERYDLPALEAPFYLRRDPAADTITPVPVVIPIAAGDVEVGDNVVEFVLTGAPENRPADTLNVHLEVPYPADAEIDYTDPLALYGDRFLAVIQPAMTNCDQYNVVEQDLGLPYPDGRANLMVGECHLMDPAEHRNR